MDYQSLAKKVTDSFVDCEFCQEHKEAVEFELADKKQSMTVTYLNHPLVHYIDFHNRGFTVREQSIDELFERITYTLELDTVDELIDCLHDTLHAYTLQNNPPNYKGLLGEVMNAINECEISQDMIESGDIQFGYTSESLMVHFPNNDIRLFIEHIGYIYVLSVERTNQWHKRSVKTYELDTFQALFEFSHETIHDVFKQNNEAKREKKDEGINWTSELNLSENMDVPIKRKMVTTLKIGQTKDNPDLILKKSISLESDESIEVTDVYMALNKEEAKKVLEELLKHTQS